MLPVTLIILAWNQWHHTRAFLDSLARHTDVRDLDILVVDNGSTDATWSELAKYRWVRTLRNPRNLGFVRGNNAGIRNAPAGNDILLLNNDVEILEDGWLDRLRAAAMSDPRAGIVGARLVLPDGRLLHAGTFIRADTCRGQQIGALELDCNQYADTRKVEGIVFACAYFKREMIQDVGLLCEDYDSYFEDTDYCLRAARAGWKTLLCGYVSIRHHEHGSTVDQPEHRATLFETSRRTFRAHWAKRLDERYSSAVTWHTITNFATGYAISAAQMIRALDEEGVRVSYRYAYGPGTPFPHEEPEVCDDPLLGIIRAREVPIHPDIEVTYAQGDVFKRNRGRFRIGFTMLEVDGFPAEWVRQANQMDEIWTPSEFNRRGLIESGVTTPIHVIPLGVDPDHFHPDVHRRPISTGEFVFVTNFEWGERKAPDLMLRTFNRTFRRDEPVLLVCKIINRDPGIDVARSIRALGLDEYGGRIYFDFNRVLPHYQLATFYRSVDCFVTTSRGEGWGLPLVEAMACGLPCIATGWGAHEALLDPDDTYALRIRGLVDASSGCPYYEGFRWAEPDNHHLSDLLRHVYEHPDEARSRGLRSAIRIRSTMTWRHTARAIAQRLSHVGAGN